MSITALEMTLRKDLLKAIAERDRFALVCVELKEKHVEHERVHALCATALKDLSSKNLALEALARQLKAGLTVMVAAYDGAAGFQKLRSGMTELAPEEVSLKQMYDDVLAACDRIGIKDPPTELKP